MALLVHLLALSSAFVPVPVAQPPVEYYAYQPTQFLGRADVEMSTKYQPGVFAAVGRKKDAKTGSTKNLMGYRVGSRAPPAAKNSGTINQYGYGIDNLYGGKKNAQVTSRGSGRTGAGTNWGPILGLLAIATLFFGAAK